VMIGTYNGLCSHSDAMSFIAFNDLYGFSLVWPHAPTVVTVLFRTQCLIGPLVRGALGGPLPCNPGPARALPTRLSVLSVRYPGVVQLRLPLGLCPRTSLTADVWSLLSALDLFFDGWSIGAVGPWWPPALQPGPGPGSAEICSPWPPCTAVVVVL